VAMPTQRWRIPLITVLAGATGLVTGSALSWRGLAGLAIVAGVALAGALVAWVVVAPGRLAPPVPAQELAQITDGKARLEAADARLRLRHDLHNGRLQTLAVVAVLAGAVLGYWQLAEDRSDAAADRELTRQAQASERFTRAINQLGDKQRVETRIGGIYGLAQVAEQAPDNNGPVGEVLLAYLNRLPRPRTPTDLPLSDRAPDVQAALTVLTQHDKNYDGIKDYAWLTHRLDLHALGLRFADLHGAQLRAADLHHADISGANLVGADLRDARLYGAQLLGARLRGAQLRSTDLGDAFLTTADLHGAQLSGADLVNTDLHAAELGDADLDKADLSEANLLYAKLGSARLSGARLGNADLRNADLRGAILADADLQGAKLDGATANDRTTWPAGFDWRRAGVEPA
jgi:uncharacterized protein YjbI with pentapeptide repeats